VVPDLPVEFDPERAIKEKKGVFQYNKDSVTRYGILKRSDDDATNIQWFNCESHFTFHFGNSWDEVNSDGQTEVYLYAVQFTDFDMENLQEEHIVNENPDAVSFVKIVFNLDTGDMKTTRLI